ncbi:MAG: hypothetical protein Q8L98_08840 [Chlamydiales bacterium]|nr:hypothetical protein [Chlamydiales bacterium]
MILEERLKTHYQQLSPKPSYDGMGGERIWSTKPYSQWPKEEEKIIAGIPVFTKRFPASEKSLPIEGYRIVEACLDVSGCTNPEVFPLWPEMEGHEIWVTIYVDALNCIRMKAIAGFTLHKTREEIKKNR